MFFIKYIQSITFINKAKFAKLTDIFFSFIYLS